MEKQNVLSSKRQRIRENIRRTGKINRKRILRQPIESDPINVNWLTFHLRDKHGHGRKQNDNDKPYPKPSGTPPAEAR